MAKTTKKQFLKFVSECCGWIDYLNLNDWECSFKHEAEEDEVASLQAEYSAKNCTFHLNQELDRANDEEICSAAKHEVIELLLMELRILSGKRTYDAEEIDRACHTVIHRLMRTVKK